MPAAELNPRPTVRKTSFAVPESFDDWDDFDFNASVAKAKPKLPKSPVSQTQSDHRSENPPKATNSRKKSLFDDDDDDFL